MVGGKFLAPLRPFLSSSEKEAIAAAVAAAERTTRGEIRVHVVAQAAGDDIVDFAKRKFAALGLHRTRERNAVLILVAHVDRRFAIWGDEGLHAKAGQPLWDRARAALEAAFSAGRYAHGIEDCVREVGAELARHFPAAGHASNQLSDVPGED